MYTAHNYATLLTAVFPFICSLYNLTHVTSNTHSCLFFLFFVFLFLTVAQMRETVQQQLIRTCFNEDTEW